jgi:hypothetical protein
MRIPADDVLGRASSASPCRDSITLPALVLLDDGVDPDRFASNALNPVTCMCMCGLINQNCTDQP